MELYNHEQYNHYCKLFSWSWLFLSMRAKTTLLDSITIYKWHLKRKTTVYCTRLMIMYQHSCMWEGRQAETCSGRVVADAKRVIGMELVLEARMEDLFAILSNSTNSFLLTSSDSTIASMMTSAEWSSFKSVENFRRWRAMAPISC